MSGMRSMTILGGVLAAMLAPAATAHGAVTATSPTANQGTSKTITWATATDAFTAPQGVIARATWQEVTEAKVSVGSAAPQTLSISPRSPGGLSASTQSLSMFVFDPPAAGSYPFSLTVTAQTCSQYFVRSGSTLTPLTQAQCGFPTSTQSRVGTWTVNAPPFNTLDDMKAFDSTIRTGQPTVVPLATLTSLDPTGTGGSTLAVKKANVDWGDGQTSQLVDNEIPGDDSDGIRNTSGPTGTQGSIRRTHAYEEAGAYVLTIGMATSFEKVTVRARANVRDAPRLRAAPITATEGAPFSGRIGDVSQDCPTCTYSATVDWGDGTVEGAPIEPITPTFRQIRGDHTWAEEGQYVVDITLTVRGPGNVLLDKETISGVATVSDAPLFASEGLEIDTLTDSVFSGTIGHLTDANPNAEVADYQVLIDWGDGKTSDGTVIADPDGGFFIRGTHIWAAEGDYNVRYKVRSTRGQEALGTAVAHVDEPFDPYEPR